MMGEGHSELQVASTEGPPAWTLDALAHAAWQLEPPAPHEKKAVLRPEAAHLVDSLLARVARGRGALDVAIGAALARLTEGDRVLQLGYSGIGDYARERLGMAGRTAQAMARLALELRTRPLLSEAVHRGEVSARKAQAVLPLARGQDEEHWVARAQTETVRALGAAVRAAGPTEAAEEEGWELICVPLSTEGRAKLDQAMALAGKLLGPGAPQWQRLEAICQEYLAAHPVEPSESEREQVLRWPVSVAGWLESAREALEEETRRWAFLCPVEPVAAPMALGEDGDADPLRLPHRLPHHLDDELRGLVAMRDGWDELVGHLGLLVSMLGLWRNMGFASFAHYCAERLGMAARTVEQRAWLERRLYALPPLRRALRDGRVGYEKARLVAAHADDTTVEALIERAQGLTCIDLKRELEARERAQMCARGELDLRVPRGVGPFLDAAVRAARDAAGYWLSPGECLARIAEHFVETWEEALTERSTRQKKVLARDAGFCQVPGCSRAAVHAHHVIYRSRGGVDEESNMVGLCAAHHLHGVHRGWVRVRGQAPEGLTWELGVRPGAAPLAEVGVH
jgi:hypothetical protein